MTLIVLTNQNSFNKTVVLTNTAYDIALSIRSAESFGLEAKLAGTAPSTGYGIDFPQTPTSSYTLFADTNSPDGSCHTLPDGGPSAPDAQY
ncbi:MAG: hypothetical protein B7W98_03645, partial [Parcubacteria group bacterium 20-58-5]